MKFLVLILFPVIAQGQIWPSKDCVDTPYIKAGSDQIFHTGKCNLGVVTSITFKTAPSFDTIEKWVQYYCPVCEQYRSKAHLQMAVENGELTKDFKLTTFGKAINKMFKTIAK